MLFCGIFLSLRVRHICANLRKIAADLDDSGPGQSCRRSTPLVTTVLSEISELLTILRRCTEAVSGARYFGASSLGRCRESTNGQRAEAVIREVHLCLRSCYSPQPKATARTDVSIIVSHSAGLGLHCSAASLLLSWSNVCYE